jgi:hypothetical protein
MDGRVVRRADGGEDGWRRKRSRSWRRRTAGFGAAADNCYDSDHAAVRRATQESIMAKGQQRSNKEARKPKKEKPKSNAANPSSKGSGGLTKG